VLGRENKTRERNSAMPLHSRVATDNNNVLAFQKRILTIFSMEITTWYLKGSGAEWYGTYWEVVSRNMV
jgi:hypothetical protein